MKFGRILGLALSLGLVVLGFFAVNNLQALVDFYIVKTVPLSSQAKALAGQIKLNDNGRYLFAAAQPAIEQSAGFNRHCSKKEAGSVVLGCYVGPQNIYIYDVTESRLDGVKQVTAAHEMLHVAYDRLGALEKKRTNKLLETALVSVQKTNPDLAERLELYDRTEPGQRSNELHSILGTEAATLPSQLESYYKKYFDDRSIVTDFAADYSAVFNNLKRNQDQLLAELETQATSINQMTQDYNAAIDQLNRDIQNFNAAASQPGGFSSQAEFEAEKTNLTQRRAELENKKTKINQAIDLYNDKKQSLESLNVEVEALNSKLDSSSLPSI